VHSRPGVAVDLVQRMYSLLTGKRVQAARVAVPAATVSVPAYAQPTAARLVYEKSREPSIELTTDEESKAAVMATTVSDHREALRKQRETDPDRFVPTSVRAERAARVIAQHSAPRAAKEDTGMRAVSVRQVKLQPLGADPSQVARVRAEREMRADAMRGLAHPSIDGGGSRASGMEMSSLLEGGGMASPPVPERRVPQAAPGSSSPPAPTKDVSGAKALAIMDSAIRRALSGSPEFSRLGPSRPAPFGLVELLTTDAHFRDDLAAAALHSVAEDAPSLADACIGSPQGFLHVLAFLQPLVSGVVEATDTFVAATQAFEEFGRCLSEQDSDVAFEMLQDLALPALLPLIKHRPAKRLHLLRILYSFTGGEIRHRRATIRSLHELLDDLPTFLSCLSLLIYTEYDLAPVLELYLYYSRIGVGVADPHLRSASVSTLAVIAHDFPAAVAPFLPRLEPLVEDTWWELRAQLAILASSFLTAVPMIPVTEDLSQVPVLEEAGSDPLAQLDAWLSGVLNREIDASTPLTPDAVDEARQSALAILDTVLRPDAAKAHALRVAVAYSAKATHSEPTIVPRVLECLVSLPVPVVARLLGIDPQGRPDELTVTGQLGGRYVQPFITESWNSEVFSRVAVERFLHEPLDSFSPQVMIALLALLRPITDPAPEEEDEPVDEDPPLRIPNDSERRLFQPLRDHIASALSRPNTCTYALEILSFVALYGDEGGDALCHDTVARTLAGLHSDLASPDAQTCLQRANRVFGKIVHHGLQGPIAELLNKVVSELGGELPQLSPLRPIANALGLDL
jgi:hypothetical protein